MSDSDESAITRLLYRYARAVDTKDWDLYRTVFTDDAVIDYSAHGIDAGPREQVTEYMSQTFSAGVAMSMHYITNIEIDVDGDAATARAMFYNPTQLVFLKDLSYFGGYYHHDLVRTADGWRSRHLREEAAWSANAPQDSPEGNREIDVIAGKYE